MVSNNPARVDDRSLRRVPEPRKRTVADIVDRRRSARETFAEIYRNNAWGDPLSRSGPGSSLEQTERIRSGLPELLARLGARSMLDLPCGDLWWMSGLILPIEHYIGADIVPELIQANRDRFTGSSAGSLRRSFVVLDIVRDPVPKVDIIFSRDCLVHLPNADCQRALNNIRASSSTWLLTTHYRHGHINEDIPVGRHRAIDLEGAPFCLPPPQELLNEGCTEPVEDAALKSLALWRCANLPSFGTGGPRP